MRGVEDLLQDYDPFRDKPRTLSDFRIAAAALERLEDPKNRWGDHWERAGVNRKERRKMLRLLKKKVGKKHLAELRKIAAAAQAVRLKNKIAATLAAQRKAELGVSL